VAASGLPIEVQRLRERDVTERWAPGTEICFDANRERGLGKTPEVAVTESVRATLKALKRVA
jgi:hypothetical protein